MSLCEAIDAYADGRRSSVWDGRVDHLCANQRCSSFVQPGPIAGWATNIPHLRSPRGGPKIGRMSQVVYHVPVCSVVPVRMVIVTTPSPPGGLLGQDGRPANEPDLAGPPRRDGAVLACRPASLQCQPSTRAGPFARGRGRLRVGPASKFKWRFKLNVHFPVHTVEFLVASRGLAGGSCALNNCRRGGGGADLTWSRRRLRDDSGRSAPTGPSAAIDRAACCSWPLF